MKTKKKAELPTFSMRRASPLAEELRKFLRPACHELAIAGSVRRGNQAMVHDIDLVAWPIYDDQEAPALFGEAQVQLGPPTQLLRLIRQISTDLGSPKPDADILRFTYQSLPVEIYLTRHDGANFGALLQLRTGSRMFNVRLATRATALGLHYWAGYGIYRGEERVDDGTEAGVFAALGLQYLEPAQRRGDALLPLL